MNLHSSSFPALLCHRELISQGVHGVLSNGGRYPAAAALLQKIFPGIGAGKHNIPLVWKLPARALQKRAKEMKRIEMHGEVGMLLEHCLSFTAAYTALEDFHGV